MLEELAEKAAAKTKPPRYINGQLVQEVFVDPASISLYVSLISGAIDLIKRCRAKRDETEEESVEVAVKILQRPTRQEQNALRRMLRRKMGWRAYFNDKGKTMKALLETGRETNHKEISEVWNEV